MNSQSRKLKWLVALLAVAVLFATNPRIEVHNQAIHRGMWRDEPVRTILGGSIGAALLSRYHTVGIASWTTVDGNLTTVGLLNHAWYLP
jgi:hypothetical protein